MSLGAALPSNEDLQAADEEAEGEGEEDARNPLDLDTMKGRRQKVCVPRQTCRRSQLLGITNLASISLW